MNSRDESLEPRLQNALDQLKPFPPRDLRVAAHGRAQFLAQAKNLQSAVPARSFWRHICWNPFFPRKEQFHMAPIIALILALTLAVGSSGAAVYASQDALPNTPLYPVKIWSENVCVALASNAETRANLLLDLAERRTWEIVALGTQNIAPGDQVLTRQRDQIQNALQIATTMQDQSMEQLLTRTRDQLREQIRIIETGESSATGLALEEMTRAREMLRAQIALAEMGLQDPPRFRIQVQQQTQTQERSRQPQPVTPAPGTEQPPASPQPKITEQPPATPQPKATGRPPASLQPKVTGQPPASPQPKATGQSPTSSQPQPQPQPQPGGPQSPGSGNNSGSGSGPHNGKP